MVTAANRPAHLDHLKSLGDRLIFAGPTLGSDDKPNGSLVVIETQTLDQANTFAASDPYAKAGLFADVTLRPWIWALGTPTKPE